MSLQTGYDHYKREIVDRFDEDSSSYGTPRAYGSLGVRVQIGMERETILKIMNSLKFNRGIDVGCGPGRYLTFTAKRRDVVGLDISVNMARSAKQNVRKTDVVLADVEHIPFRDGSFDLLYSIRAMKYLRNKSSFCARLRGSVHPMDVSCSTTSGTLRMYPTYSLKPACDSCIFFDRMIFLQRCVA